MCSQVDCAKPVQLRCTTNRMCSLTIECVLRLIVLNQCNYVVLDEADRMIDLGFEPQVCVCVCVYVCMFVCVDVWMHD